jgi:K+-transporting ATPase KdpF subunit
VLRGARPRDPRSGPAVIGTVLGIVLAVALVAYLLAALLFPERF